MYEREEAIMFTDGQSRALIVNDTNTNYFVEASAGSGKTYSLVLRMVAMIEGNEARKAPTDPLIAPVPVDQICTITFTKAAAAEFFSRFQEALSKRSVNKPYDIDNFLGPKTPVTMERCQKALENIDLCFLGTIDAFCNMIAHELPTELNIPSDSSVVAEDDLIKILKEVYEGILKDPTNKYHQKALQVQNLFPKASYCFAKTAKELADLRNTRIEFDRQLAESSVDSYITQAEKDQFIEYVKILCSDVVVFKGSTDTGRKGLNAQAMLLGLRSKINPTNWANCLPVIIDALAAIGNFGGFDKSMMDPETTIKNLFIRETTRSGPKFTDDALEFFAGLKRKIDNYKFSVLCGLAEPILEETFRDLKNQGMLGYFDYLFYLTEALKKDFKGRKVIIDHIIKRHSRFLLDESQDTNPLQTELFFYLTGTNQAAKDWTETKPYEGALFIVGDPKQSIYGFRNANVQAFNKVKAVFEKDGKVLVLTKNFRSKEVLKRWFNDSMNYVLQHGLTVDLLTHIDIPLDPNKEKEQSADVKLDNGKLVEPYQGVYKYMVDEVRDDQVAVAKLIVDMVEVSKKMIWVKNKKTDKLEFRPVRYGDIRVVPVSSSVDDYIDAFNTYGIPVTVEAKVPFNMSESLIAIRDLVCLLKDPTYKPALLKVLYGPLFRLNDSDINQMVLDHFALDITNLTYLDKNKDVQSITFTDVKHQKAIDLLNRLWEVTKNFSFSSTMVYLLNNKELDVFSKVRSDFLEYTVFLIEKIKEKEESGLMEGIRQFKEFVDSFISSDTDDSRTVRFKDESNRVILSNLHKVKGLQAPVVLLVHPNKSPRNAIKHVDYSEEQPVTMINGINDSGNYGNIATGYGISDIEQAKWNECSKAEERRVEYVGATRAESTLIVASKKPPEESDKAEPDYNPWKELADKIPSSSQIVIPDVNPNNIVPKKASLIDVQNHFDGSKQTSVVLSSPSKRAGDVKVTPQDNNNDAIKEEAPSSEEDTSSTEIGTIIHRLMECLISSREHPYKDLSLLVNQIINEYHADGYKGILMGVAETVVKKGGYAENNANIRDIYPFLLKAEEVYCETPFSYKKGNEIINGVIDLIYKDKDGYHIIDYKTNKQSDIASLEKHYEGQLNDYINVLKEMGIEADAHIYHISYPRQ